MKKKIPEWLQYFKGKEFFIGKEFYVDRKPDVYSCFHISKIKILKHNVRLSEWHWLPYPHYDHHMFSFDFLKMLAQQNYTYYDKYSKLLYHLYSYF